MVSLSLWSKCIVTSFIVFIHYIRFNCIYIVLLCLRCMVRYLCLCTCHVGGLLLYSYITISLEYLYWNIFRFKHHYIRSCCMEYVPIIWDVYTWWRRSRMSAVLTVDVTTRPRHSVLLFNEIPTRVDLKIFLPCRLKRCMNAYLADPL